MLTTLECGQGYRSALSFEPILDGATPQPAGHEPYNQEGAGSTPWVELAGGGTGSNPTSPNNPSNPQLDLDWTKEMLGEACVPVASSPASLSKLDLKNNVTVTFAAV
ncbi:hypothetical protein RRG08_045506 [Elysia crispata]|uniref:Uncharacterized protein n=1 Tax=Elysia crispata TaxID=231223 RepID=A0AAE1DXN4_9GAST|nr:hypothetical protein RRG08_045506 [Elysia crispata]